MVSKFQQVNQEIINSIYPYFILALGGLAVWSYWINNLFLNILGSLLVAYYFIVEFVNLRREAKNK